MTMKMKQQAKSDMIYGITIVVILGIGLCCATPFISKQQKTKEEIQQTYYIIRANGATYHADSYEYNMEEGAICFTDYSSGKLIIIYGGATIECPLK